MSQVSKPPPSIGLNSPSVQNLPTLNEEQMEQHKANAPSRSSDQRDEEIELLASSMGDMNPIMNRRGTFGYAFSQDAPDSSNTHPAVEESAIEELSGH